MSYQFIRATAVQNESLSGERPVDITGISLQDLVANYSLINIVYYDSIFKKQFCLNTAAYLGEFQNYTGTIAGWLNDKNGIALKYLSTMPGNTLKYAKCGDMQLYDYRLFPGNHEIGTDKQDDLTIDEAPDIRIKSGSTLTEKKDWAKFAKVGLFTVNGHFTRAFGFDDALYLAGAGKNFLINDNIHVNCIDLTNVCTFTTYDFSQAKITFIKENGYNGIHVDLQLDVTNKDVWFVVAGRLMMGPQILRNLGGSLYRLELNNIDLPNKLFESLEYIDLRPALTKGRSIISPEELESENFVRKLLSNINSFFIVFDTPVVGVTITPLQTYTYPTVLQANDRFQHPVMLSNGLFPAYRTRYQGNTILMDIDMRLEKTHINDSTGLSNGGNFFHSYRDMYDPHRMVLGYSFKIHTLQTSD